MPRKKKPKYGKPAPVPLVELVGILTRPEPLPPINHDKPKEKTDDR
tara:strand:- start:189 stop:326 length:138 start_codon:yes stop_codon:yes gene_type:complete